MAGYRSKKLMADRHADPITLDHIIELRKKLAIAEQQRDNALSVVRDLRMELWKAKEFKFEMVGSGGDGDKYKPVHEGGSGGTGKK